MCIFVKNMLLKLSMKKWLSDLVDCMVYMEIKMALSLAHSIYWLFWSLYGWHLRLQIFYFHSNCSQWLSLHVHIFWICVGFVVSNHECGRGVDLLYIMDLVASNLLQGAHCLCHCWYFVRLPCNVRVVCSVWSWGVHSIVKLNTTCYSKKKIT